MTKEIRNEQFRQLRQSLTPITLLIYDFNHDQPWSEIPNYEIKQPLGIEVTALYLHQVVHVLYCSSVFSRYIYTICLKVCGHQTNTLIHVC